MPSQHYPSRLAIVVTTMLTAGCQWNLQAPDTSSASNADSDVSPALSGRMEDRARHLFKRYRQWHLEQDPILASQLHEPVEQHWPDLSPEAIQQRQQWLKLTAERLNALDLDRLPEATALHVRALNLYIEADQAALDCQTVTAPFGQHQLWHQRIATTLKQQSIQDIQGFHRYLERLQASAILLQQWQQQIERAQADGLTPPASVQQQVDAELSQWLEGFPFSDSASPTYLWTDIQHKINGLKLYPKSQAILEKQAKSVLTNQLLPALRQLKATIAQGTTNDAQTPNADQQRLQQQCYSETLALQGTINSADNGSASAPASMAQSAHLAATQRLQVLEQQLSTLLQLDPGEAFAPQLRTWMATHQPQPANRLQDSRTRLTELNTRLPEVFAYLPKTPLIITQAPQQQGYYPPVTAIQKPGFYYVASSNVTDSLQQWPSALYQQTLPGRHLQTALAMENTQLPSFLSTPGLAWHIAGWPLFSAELAGKIGGYRSNQEQAGVLISELNAQLDLILDTATHALGWTEQDRLDMCVEHSAFSPEACQQRLGRIQANPGHYAATALSLAQLRQLEQNAKARKVEAGNALMAPVFYSQWLSQGSLPAELYDQWLEQHTF